MNDEAKAVIEVSGAEFAASRQGAPAADEPGFRRLRDNPLDGFRNGACLDLRVRFAMLILENNPAMTGIVVLPGENRAGVAARYALEVATELFAQADARGLIEPFAPMDDFLRDHVKRATAFQIENQKEQQRQQDQSVRVAGAVRDAIHRPN